MELIVDLFLSVLDHFLIQALMLACLIPQCLLEPHETHQGRQERCSILTENLHLKKKVHFNTKTKQQPLMTAYRH